MSRTSVSVRALRAAAISAAAGCASACASGGGSYLTAEHLEGHDYSYAVYDPNDELVHSPIENLRREMATRFELQAQPISDVYVIAHGWNFTIEESVRLYEDYRTSLEPTIHALQEQDGKFQPYFIFVVWSSVTRPVSSAIRSLLPWTPPTWLSVVTEGVDEVAFHIPSVWGESQHALRVGVGSTKRCSEIDPTTYSKEVSDSDYARKINEGRADGESVGFHGYEAPLSVILDELIRIRLSPSASVSAPKVHVVGHSFGAKLVSVATYDAVARVMAAEIAGNGPTGATPDAPLIDSLLLISPAFQIPEMYFDVAVRFPPRRNQEHEDWLRKAGALQSEPRIHFVAASQRITSKAIVHSSEDSANGWLFAIGNSILNHDAIADAQHIGILSTLDEVSGKYSDSRLPWWKRFLWAPVSTVAGATTLVAGAVYGVVGTVFIDVSALIDGPAMKCRDMWADSGKPLDLACDVVELPFSPLLVQEAAGNQGTHVIRKSVSFLNLRSWLDKSAVDYLEESVAIDDQAFLRFTDAPGQKLEFPRSRFWACDAAKVYNGNVASLSYFGKVTNLIPPGAHDDVRSWDKVSDRSKTPETIELEKRYRTFNFIYNMTH